jgi:hypothetical protein
MMNLEERAWNNVDTSPVFSMQVLTKLAKIPCHNSG